jgi:polysaccharide export outer membrane protein
MAHTMIRVSGMEQTMWNYFRKTKYSSSIQPFRHTAGILALFILLGAGLAFGQKDRIRKGDILEINVYQHPDLSKSVIVQASGFVDYPLVSNIPVDGLTLDELRSLLNVQIAKYIGENPIITVWFAQTLLIHVTVLGQVTKPGEYAVPKNATIQGAIAQAGGLTPRAELDSLWIIRKLTHGEDTISVNLARFFQTADLRLLPGLEEGDVIFVPGTPGSNDVKVMGAVRLPGSYTVYLGATVLDVIFMAGGPIEKKANLKRVRLVSPSNAAAREVELNIDDLLKGKGNSLESNPAVQPGDVVYVPERSFSFIETLKTVTSILTPIALLLYYTGTISPY